MQGREGNKKHSWKNYQWLSYQALPGAQWEVSTLAAAFIHLLGDFWLILSELLVRSPAGVCSTIHSEPSCINQCWTVANEGEELTNKSVPAVCRAHLILNNFAISVTLCGHHTGRVLALQKHKAFDSSIYTHSHPHPSCTGKGQLESFFFGTQSPAILLGTFGYFPTWLI